MDACTPRCARGGLRRILGGSVLLPLRGQETPTQAVRLGSRCLYILSHLAGPALSF